MKIIKYNLLKLLLRTVKGFLLCVTMANTAFALSGELDSSFSFDGKVATDIDISVDRLSAMAIQPNGKILAAGFKNKALNSDFVIVRYNSDGTLDNSFGVDGKVITDFGSLFDTATSIALQLDGKVVVSGYTDNGNDTDFAVARYNSNGLLDPAFGANGKITTDINLSDDIANALAIQTDGKIIVVGYSFNNADTDFALVRYNSNGSLDSTFDADGKVTTNVGSAIDDAKSVILQNDSKIIVVGDSYNNSDKDISIIRYNSNGSVDNAFGNSGIVKTDINLSDDEANSVIVQSDGKLLVCGESYNGQDTDFFLVRYNINGNLDTSFDSDGKVTTDFGASNDSASSIAVQTNGKIIVIGVRRISIFSSDIAIARFNLNGLLDTSFNLDGKVTTDISSVDEAKDVSIQQDGKIVVAGYTENLLTGLDFTVVRYLGDLAPTAATANLSGRVITEQGRGISRTRVTLTNINGETRTILTNQFGYFRFSDLAVGELYVISVASKRFQFNQNSQTHQLLEDFDGLQFVGNTP
jgi:uncharacterized delta-60 repeat protein